MSNSTQKPIKKSKMRNVNIYGYFFLIPFFVIFLVFQLVPMINTISMSFYDIAGFSRNGDFILFDNYTQVLGDPIFIQSIGNTFIIWMLNFIPQMLVALLGAVWFTALYKMRGTGFFKVVFYMPNIITAASMAVLFFSLGTHPDGAIDQILTSLGVSHEFNIFNNEWASRIYIAFIQFLMWFGNTMIILIAGILGINTDYYEAASVDGASTRKMFFKITLPLIKPIMLYVLVTSLIGGLQVFDIPFLLNGGGPRNSTMTMSVYIYQMAFKGEQNYGVASAASVVLFLISITISIIMFRTLNPKKEKTLG